MSISTIDKIFNEINIDVTLNDLKSVHLNLLEINRSNIEFQNIVKNMTVNFEELILNLKKTEENDLFLLINLVCK